MIYAILFLVATLLSGLFSSSESAFFSLSPVDLGRLRNDGHHSAKRVILLLEEPQKLLLTIFIGTIISTVLASAAAILFAYKSFGNTESYGGPILGVLVIVVAFALLILTRILSKVLAVRSPGAVSLKLSLFNYWFYLLSYPVSAILEQFTRFIGGMLKIEGNLLTLSQEEVRSMIEMGEEKGTIHTEEKEMIKSIFEFSETTTKEIMVPRIDMVCLEVSSSVSDLVKIVREKGHSRIPVYEDRIDNLKGVVHVKDFIPELVNGGDKIDLKKLMRPAFFVPENKKIDDLLREFQQEKIHMAIVVDEYGGTAGLVTFEDVIEEIVGEIQDEHDKEQPLYRMLEPGTYLVDGRITIDELNNALPEPILQSEEEDYETLGGLIYHITESIPNKSDHVSYLNYDFVIEDVDRQRIRKVKVIHKADSQANSQPEQENSDNPQTG